VPALIAHPPFFGVLTVLSLLFELRLPFVSLLYAVPPFSLTAGNLTPDTYMTGVAILAAFGVDALGRKRGGVTRRAWVALLILCLLTLALALAIYFAVENWNLEQLLQRRKSHSTMLDLYRPLTWRLYSPLVFGFAAVGLYYAYYRRWLGWSLVMGATVLLVAAELYAFGWDYNPTLPPDRVFPETAAIRFVREQADLGQDGYLVLTDANDPGWQALVDSRPVSLLRANDVFRAVTVTAGEHIITFHYEPRAVQVGLYVTVAGLALLMGTVILALVVSVLRSHR
jgi:hypothetical protein